MASGRSRHRSTKGRRLVAAGQILGVGTVCFAFWLLLDARQLYDSAIASPLGARRSVAMAILRPIARVSEALSLDRPVRGADHVLGRDGTPGGSVGGDPVPSREEPGAGAGGRPPARGGEPGSTSTTTSPPVPVSSLVPAGPPALAPPAPGHVLTILSVGDSIGEDLGYGLGDVLGGDPGLRIVQDAVGSTGLAAIDYYDWPAELEVELHRYRPQIVVVMLGGNDAQSFDLGARYVGFGTALWRRVYGARVATMMDEATAAGAHVLWVGMPVMSPAATLSDVEMRAENSVYAAEARVHPGVRFMSTWKLLASPSGGYSEYLPDASGDLVQARDSDGIHIDAPGGTDILARAAVAAVEQAWHVRL